ncbi:MAG: hypothetical protein JW754_02595 [Candidatus Aenigmarchaeota archaeon]|nr:hypothetical protein [Candidatus Aenigmarchaeota archaeon]
MIILIISAMITLFYGSAIIEFLAPSLPFIAIAGMGVLAFIIITVFLFVAIYVIVLILVAVYYVVKHPMEVSGVDKGYTITKTKEAGKRQKGRSKKKK